MPDPAPPFWPDSNWVYQLIKGLPNDDLIEIAHQCLRNDADTPARLSKVLLILFKEMAAKVLMDRGLEPPPGGW